jgi:hypothetical protein
LLPLSLGLLGGSLGVLVLAERLAGAAGTCVAIGAVTLGGIGLVMLLVHLGFAIARAQAPKPEPRRFMLPTVGLFSLLLQINRTSIESSEPPTEPSGERPSGEDQ